MTIRLARDGGMEFMDETAGPEHVAQLFDFAGHKLYTTDLKTNKCTVETYARPRRAAAAARSRQRQLRS